MRNHARWRPGALLLCAMSLFSCDAPGPETSAPLDNRSMSLAGEPPGEIALKPNVIRGTATLTNKNLVILDMLAKDPWHTQGYAYARSTKPSGYSAYTYSVKYVSPTQFTFEMPVEATAGGTEGVLYEMVVDRGTWRDPPVYFDSFHFPLSSNIRVQSIDTQPLPTEVEFKSCLGVLQLDIGLDDECRSLATGIRNLSLEGFKSYGTENSLTTYIRAENTTSTKITYDISTPNGLLRISEPINWSKFECDKIVHVCKRLHDPISSPTGGITGPVGILGETFRSNRSISAIQGPSNHALTHSALDSAPIGEPSTWWTLSPLLVGTYNGLYMDAMLRTKRTFTQLRPPAFHNLNPELGRLNVIANTTSQLIRVINGEVRYPFLMNPAFFEGTIRLANPSVPKNPGFISTLQNLYFEADYDNNNDGIPNTPSLQQTRLFASLGRDKDGSLGFSTTAFPGRFEPTMGELSSRYEQVLPGTYDLPYTWIQHGLKLRFWSQGESFNTHPGLYDARKFRNGWLELSSNTNRSKKLGPGERHTIDHEYCFNELKLFYRTEFGRFYNPALDVSGGYQGKDWREQDVNYSATGTFYGDPYVNGYPVGNHPKETGFLYMTLPQGTFNLKPHAMLVNDVGGATEANFAPVSVTAGCGQAIQIVPPLAVNLHPISRCAASGDVAVSGVVKSLPAEVDRIWYQVNDGPEITLCTHCGQDVPFSFTAHVQSCENTVKVFADAKGLEQPAMSSQQVVWDDPSDGPSCPGTSCVNRPPVARCHNVTVPADASCTSGCGSVDDGSYDPDPGDTVSCTQTPDCPYQPGTQDVTLTCQDSAGNRASCTATVTVKDLAPPVITCPSVPVLACVAGGAPASFAPTAQDACGAVSTTCAPASGASFPLGTTRALCTATDTAGNRASCAFDVTVQDDAPPVLTLLGPDTVTLGCGVASYTEPGYSALDVCAGDLRAQVQVSGKIDAAVPGRYPLTYSVGDGAGHTATATRTVEVRRAEGGCCGATTGHFVPTASGTSTLHQQHTATALGDGRVLVVGGYSPTAELYDAPTGTWRATGAPSTSRRLHTATRLTEGRVLVAGGDGTAASHSAEVYDPNTGAWAPTGALLTPRREHAAVRLKDGRVLLMGGQGDTGQVLSSAELYEPTTGTWHATGALHRARRAFSATPLADGRVLVAGGLTDTGDSCRGGNCLSTAEVYDPATGTWSDTGGMLGARGFHAATALADGQVLVSGGDLDGPGSTRAELFDPGPGTWRLTGDMRSPRRRHSLTPLPDGRILAAGGYDASLGIQVSAELFEPLTGTWCPTGALGQGRYEHTATLLPEGQVLITAGLGLAHPSTAEVYSWTK
jgi:hypothetical protein